MQRAQHPETTADEITRGGLQFFIRGDVVFQDGSIVTLDELFAGWGLDPLSLLEPYPPELEINWKV